MAGDDEREPGRRKDGKPFKEGNTREDGSYEVGKFRTPTHSRFEKNDGRPRGKRPKGGKNLMSEWREELAAKVTVNEGGKVKRITKRRALIKSKIDRGIKKSDRAAETALRYAEASEQREPALQADDFAIIKAWFRSINEDGNSDDCDQQEVTVPNVTDG